MYQILVLYSLYRNKHETIRTGWSGGLDFSLQGDVLASSIGGLTAPHVPTEICRTDKRCILTCDSFFTRHRMTAFAYNWRSCLDPCVSATLNHPLLLHSTATGEDSKLWSFFFSHLFRRTLFWKSHTSKAACSALTAFFIHKHWRQAWFQTVWCHTPAVFLLRREN